MQEIKNFINNLNQSTHAIMLIQSVESNANEFIQNYIKKVIDLNCSNEQEKTELFNKIDKNEYFDLIVFDGAKSSIKKEDIVYIQNQFTRPGLEKINQKFYVLKNFEYATKQAVNSLLKFLEEPTENTCCILTTSNVNLILETIISRCQKVILQTDYQAIDNVVKKYNLSSFQQQLYINSFNDVSELELFVQTADFKELNDWFDQLLKQDLTAKNQKDLNEKFKSWDYSKILFVIKCLSNYFNDARKLKILQLIDDLKYNPVKTLIFFNITQIIKE